MTEKDDDRPSYTSDDHEKDRRRSSTSTGWFVGIIVALALLAIGYMVFTANDSSRTGPVSTTTAPAN